MGDLGVDREHPMLMHSHWLLLKWNKQPIFRCYSFEYFQPTEKIMSYNHLIGPKSLGNKNVSKSQGNLIVKNVSKSQGELNHPISIDVKHIWLESKLKNGSNHTPQYQYDDSTSHWNWGVYNVMNYNPDTSIRLFLHLLCHGFI